MSDIPTAAADELSSSFYFPDPSTALTFFNNDLTELALQSDEGFVVDGSEAVDESAIPSSYMMTFQVQPLSSLIESDNTGEAMASSQSSSGSNNGGYNEDSSSEEIPSPSTPKDSETSSSPNSPVIYNSSSYDSDSDGNDSQETRPHLLIHHYRHRRNMSKLKAEVSIKRAKFAAELTPNFPSYHVYQLNGPMHARQLVKGREQYRKELRAFHWDTTDLFKSSKAPSSAQYKTELAEYRRLRWKYINNEPTSQQRRHSQRLLERLAQIKKSRKEVARKRRVT
jgi:hypothetical protein